VSRQQPAAEFYDSTAAATALFLLSAAAAATTAMISRCWGCGAWLNIPKNADPVCGRCDTELQQQHSSSDVKDLPSDFTEASRAFFEPDVFFSS